MRSILFFSLLMTCSLAKCQLQVDPSPADLPNQALPSAGHAFPDGEAPQICFEIRFVSATAETARHLKQASLVRSAPQTPELTLADVSGDELAQAGGIRLVSSTSVVAQQQPVFVERLNDDDVRQWIQTAQTDPRSNILMAPKVTLFNRQVAQIDDTTSRPFVVGVTPNGNAYAPQIQTFEDGTQLTLRGTVQPDDSIRVDLRARFSSVEDVGIVDAGPADVTLQVPQVRSHDIQLSAVVGSEQTLAIWGFQPAETEPARNQAGGPVVSRIPYRTRLFRNTSSDKSPQKIALLIRPKILHP